VALLRPIYKFAERARLLEFLDDSIILPSLSLRLVLLMALQFQFLIMSMDAIFDEEAPLIFVLLPFLFFTQYLCLALQITWTAISRTRSRDFLNRTPRLSAGWTKKFRQRSLEIQVCLLGHLITFALILTSICHLGLCI
jgi:hypothetical protein